MKLNTDPNIADADAFYQKLVELHGGTIRASSTPGSGSVFVFTMPTAP